MKNVKIHEFPEFTVVEYYKKGITTLFVLSNASVFYYLIYSAPPYDIELSLPLHPCIFFSSFPIRRHKRLTYNLIVSYIKNKGGNKGVPIIEFSTWLTNFKMDFEPDLAKFLRDIAIKYEPLLFS